MFFINQDFIKGLPDLSKLDYILRNIEQDTKHPATLIVEHELFTNKELLDYLGMISIDPLIGGVTSYTRDNIINFALDWLNIVCYNCKNKNHNYSNLICKNIKQLVNTGKEYDLQNCRGQIQISR